MGEEVKELTIYQREINDLAAGFDDMFKQSEALVVDNDEKHGQANEMIAQAKKLSGRIEDRRVGIYGELYPKKSRSIMKEVNERAKLYKDRLSTICIGLEAKFLGYQERKRQAAIKLEAERIAKEEAERKAHEKKMAHVPPEIREEAPNKFLAPTPTTPTTPKMIQGHTGSSYTKKEKYFVMVDFSKVPDGYKTLDERRVRRAMHDGIEVPGIEFKVRDKLATRLK